MSKILTQTLTINLSMLVKDSEQDISLNVLSPEVLASLTEIIEELVNNPKVVVETIE